MANAHPTAIFFIALTFLTTIAPAVDIPLDNKTFHLPDGFTIKKVAGPPLVNRPVTADFDDQGRLYVTDNNGTGDNLQKQLKDPPHRILRLEDSDGDGRFDKQTLFADHVMFPEGSLWFDGSLYVSAVPSIWKFTGHERSEWFQGKTMTGCGNDLHGPYLGPDGWIYWCKGAFAQQTYDRPGHKPLVTRAAHILRARPDGSGIEPVMTGGMDNPVEVVFTPGGERIFTTTFLVNPANGQRDGIIHAIYGGIYGKIHDVIDDHPHTFPEVMPIMIHTGPAAQCALVRYESAIFGPEYQDNLFASSFNLHKVTRHILTPDGATFKSKDEDFLTCDSFDFHPTHLIEDADGSLLVIDTGGWYKLCCPTSQLGKPDVTGAIYRIRKTGAAKVQDPRGLKLPWPQMKPDDLASLLADPRPAMQKRAIQAIAKLGVPALPALKNILTASGSSNARLNAVWSATQITDAQAREVTRLALADRNQTVRQAAIHSASVWRDHDLFDALIPLLDSDSMHNRRAAAEALGRLSDPRAVPALFAALQKPLDHILEHSLTYALIEISDPKSTSTGLP
jgi:putative membrane-bound dehydrogenase-like protein